ncbi:MAG: pilus assembly protein PilM, partial [Armatimonadetes bacterium]|nr:pilus assembly protein PilM [Armatimonadota bacterium]
MISDLLSSLSKDRTSVGIELSKASLRVAQVRRGRSGYVLERLLEEGLPEGLVDDNGVKDAAGVASFCGEYLREKKITVQEVVLGVPERAVVIRMAALPSDLKDSELKKGLAYTFKRELPVDPSELSINYRMTEEQLDEGKSRQLVVAALGKQVGQELKDAFKVRGLRISAIEFPSLALSRLTSFFSPDPDHLRVILNLGASFTDLTLVDRGISCYATNFNVGAGDFAQMLSSASGAGSGGEDEFLMAIEPILNRVNIEIYRAIKYLQTVRKRTKEVDILLAGGWPQLPNFEMLLKGFRKKLNVPLSLPNLGDMRLIKGSDLEGVDFPSLSPIMAAAVGLALRPFDLRGIAMDLSANSAGGRGVLSVPLKPALAGALVFFLLLGGVGLASSKVFHKRHVVAEAPAPLITSVPTPAVPSTQATSSSQSSKGFKEPHSTFSEILDDLSRISKERLVFDEITLDNTGEVKLTGSALRQTHVFM